eukprot:scaffold265038_cov32-Tisochrysis_lutea.AAC.2
MQNRCSRMQVVCLQPAAPGLSAGASGNCRTAYLDQVYGLDGLDGLDGLVVDDAMALPLSALPHWPLCCPPVRGPGRGVELAWTKCSHCTLTSVHRSTGRASLRQALSAAIERFSVKSVGERARSALPEVERISAASLMGLSGRDGGMRPRRTWGPLTCLSSRWAGCSCWPIPSPSLPLPLLQLSCTF